MSDVSGNVDHEGLVGRELEDHRVGFRRAAIVRRYHADHPDSILLHPFKAAVVRGEWLP